MRMKRVSTIWMLRNEKHLPIGIFKDKTSVKRYMKDFFNGFQIRTSSKHTLIFFGGKYNDTFKAEKEGVYVC